VRAFARSNIRCRAAEAATEPSLFIGAVSHLTKKDSRQARPAQTRVVAALPACYVRRRSDVPMTEQCPIGVFGHNLTITPVQ
jgi:hypothetical protein